MDFWSVRNVQKYYISTNPDESCPSRVFYGQCRPRSTCTERTVSALIYEVRKEEILTESNSFKNDKI